MIETPWTQVVGRFLDGCDGSASSLGRILGHPESTLRGWRDRGGSPDFNVLCSRRRSMPTALLLDLVQTLAGPRITCTLAPLGGPAAANPILTLSDIQLACERQWQACREWNHHALADGRIDPAGHKQFVAAEIAKWSPIIKAAGVYAD